MLYKLLEPFEGMKALPVSSGFLSTTAESYDNHCKKQCVFVHYLFTTDLLFNIEIY